MSRVIAGVYEIQNKIGEGGGGIVYLGRHLRLDKQVVLKADRRTLQTKPETLRREVDMLKGLSHTYIPQVYDFVQEDGVVYTVMDFIEGESLDKLLKRNQPITQPQVISWACQLLEALVYLHGRPPHGILHGDIKPANIMLRRSGDICLIDYNIALALGENGAVKAGFSRGYASPEHYGIEYAGRKRGTSESSLTAMRASRQNFPEKKAESKEVCETMSVGAAAETEAMVTETTEVLPADVTETMPGEVTEGTFAGATETMAAEAPQMMGEYRAASSAAWKSTDRHLSGGLQMSGGSQSSGGSSTGGQGSVLLDVRSDIYSLGATLYHLLSGQRPAQDALVVAPLGADICSPAVSGILQKSMEPDPAMRYQTAQEMLDAFLGLYDNDERTIRHKKRIRRSAAALATLFLAGGVSAFIGLKQLEQRQAALALAEYSGNALAKGDVFEAVSLSLQAIPEGKSIWEAPVTAQAQKALTDALGVYDLSDGFKALETVELPGAPMKLAMSPEGTRFAAVYAYEVMVFDLESGHEILTLPMQESALSDVVFLDENCIVYAGIQGVTAYDMEAQEARWTQEPATTLAVSEDHSVVAAVNRDESHAAVYDADDGRKRAECFFEGKHLSVAVNDIFADPKDSIFVLNRDGSMLAVSFSDGGLMLFDLHEPEQDLIIYETSDYVHFEGGFYGDDFAFTAEQSGESLFGIVDTVEAVYMEGYRSRNRLLMTADGNGICLADGNLLVRLSGKELRETELAYADGANITAFAVGENHVLVATDKNQFSFYDSSANRMSVENGTENSDFVILGKKYAVVGNRSEPFLRILKLEDHREAQLLSYDAHYSHDEARISADKKTAMLFGYQDFRIYSMDGKLVAQEKLPDAEQIYDQQFRKDKDRSWLEVIWYDGTVRCYSAADGSLIQEERKEAPAKDLYEEFFTDRYRIASVLHGTPEVYDLETGKSVGKLEEDSYLTYVTQVGENLMTEYISAAGERYGLLLNENLQTLAYLPKLCDISDGMAVFDDKSGNLRQCSLYSLRELIALGEEIHIEEKQKAE